MIRVAYLCEPHVGGTFSFFLKLRPALAERGIDFRCVCPFNGTLYEGSEYEGLDGVDYLELEDDPAVATRRIISHLQAHEVAVVLVLPGAYEIATNLPRYLPAEFRCVARLPHNARGVYLPTRFIADYLDRIVTVSDRLQSDLIDQYGVNPSKISCIYNGIAVTSDPRRSARPVDEPCRLIFVGRVEDLQKNVLLLPDMMRLAMQQVPSLHLTVVGGGPDLDVLRARLKKAGVDQQTDLLGYVPRSEVAKLLGESHVFLLPSRFEGSPNALLEAMQAECAPVVSNIRGISDVFVEDGVSGVIVRMGDANDFADAVVRLASDEALRAAMGRAARKKVQEQFSLERMVADYEELFVDVVNGPGCRKKSLSLNDYEMPDLFGPTWRRYVPAFIKKFVRTRMERMGKSV